MRTHVLLDFASATEYEDTDNDIPSRRPSKSYRKRRSRHFATKQSRRVFAACLGKTIDTNQVGRLLQNTGFVVRSQPYGCVYCVRRILSDLNDRESKTTTPLSPITEAATTTTSIQVQPEQEAQHTNYTAWNANKSDYEGDKEGEDTSPKASKRKVLDNNNNNNNNDNDNNNDGNRYTQHIFLFDFGCLVCWGCTGEEERTIVSSVQHLIQDISTFQEDDMSYVYSDRSNGRWKSDEINLSSQSPIEKFAISLAFAQSVKLKVYEENVYKVIEESRPFPEALAQTGEIVLTQRQVSKKIGELFIVRYQIFLESEMLETPEFFWESDEWEPTYVKARKYLNIGKRLDVLQQRLDVVRELLDMLANALDNQHANRLEWIIVVLIVAEVVCQILFGIVDFKCWVVCPQHGSGGGGGGDL